MTDKKKTHVIILARGGSKGIPKKNIIDFCGKPLVAWSIIQAKKIKEISKVWVSSDNNDILKVARKYGAETIKRPKYLATSKTKPILAWLHAIEKIKKMGNTIDVIIALQSTSPVRESKDIKNGIRKFLKNNYDSLFSASYIGDFYIWRKKGNSYSSINYDYKNRPRRQDFEKQYVENGSFYIFKPTTLKKYQNHLGGRIGMSLMEFWKSFEIDEHDDVKFLEIIMKNYLLKDTKRR